MTTFKTNTLFWLRRALRYRINDYGYRKNAYSNAALDEMLNTALKYLAMRIPMAEKWETAAINFTAGSSTATFNRLSAWASATGDTAISQEPWPVQYINILAIRRTSDGRLLDKRTPEELDRIFWSGDTDSTKQAADPTDYAVWEGDDGVLTIRFQAPCETSGTLDIFRTVFPSEINLSTSLLDQTGKNVFTLSAAGIDILLDTAAIEAASKMTPQQAQERNFNPAVVKVWQDRLKRAEYDEQVRRNRLKSVGRQLRF